MATKMKEYRYYLSSGVNTGIRVKISLLELAPASSLSADPLNGAASGQLSLTADPKTYTTTTTSSSSSSSSSRLRAFDPPGLEQRSGSHSELRNATINEIFVTAQIFSDGLPLHAMVISSKGPTKCSDSTIYWNEWLAFPVKYRDLARNSQLAITVWSVGWEPIGGTTLPFFTKQGVLRDGMQCLRMWKAMEADPSPFSATPSEMDGEWTRQECYRLDKLREKYERKEMSRNEWMDGVTDRRIARIRRGSEPPSRKEPLGPFCSYREDAVLWIELPYFGDVVVYEEEPYSQRSIASSLYAKEMKQAGAMATANVATTLTGNNNNNGGGGGPPSTPSNGGGGGGPNSSPQYGVDAYGMMYDPTYNTRGGGGASGGGGGDLPSGGSGLIVVWDPDVTEENPAERKYRKLARDILRGSIDPNLKPSRDEKARIEALLAMPTDNLKNEEKDLLWKFRYTLTDNKKAVIKFLLSVDWNDETEVKQATDLLHQWCEIDTADALKLLGRDKEFKHEMVRNFAVTTLARAKNEDLQDFLLQLVQALRYEKPVVPIAATATPTRGGGGAGAGGAGAGGGDTGSTDGNSYLNELGPLARFLIDRAGANFQMANYFYWYLKVEASNYNRDGELFRSILNAMLDDMKHDSEKRPIYDMLMAQVELMDKVLTLHNKAREDRGRKEQKEEKFRHYLKQFAWQKGVVIRMPLDPTVHLSGIIPSSAQMFKSALYPAVVEFQTVLPVDHGSGSSGSGSGSYHHGHIHGHHGGGAGIHHMAGGVASTNNSLPYPHPLPGHALSQSQGPNAGATGSHNSLLLRGSNDSILDNNSLGQSSSSYLGAAQASSNMMTESALLRDSLSTRVIHYLNRDKEGPSYKVMVKNGDDLRQDQLIMQMFILMDRLLKRVNLDLKLTPYRILATGPSDGLMEFVQDSYAVGSIVSNYASPPILSFLRKHNPDSKAEYGVAPEALNTYVKSLAGYCVLTYILGIGDRHLDNVMMKSQGNLFHIDFGFIFGADPKPYPPPFKLTKEMVEGMGGPESEHYMKFKRYCCQAYNWLRKSADLILNLLSLMADGGIEELSNDPVTTLQKVQEKFRLDLTDEQAEQFFLGLISDSVTALFPVLVEIIHKFATRMK